MSTIEPLPVNVKKALEEQNKLRAKLGFRILKIKIRSCLGCEKKFESVDRRFCYDCNEDNSNVYYTD